MSASSARIEVIRADITTLEVDVIVNAANSHLVPGGGVDGAINDAAGPQLENAMRAIGSCPTGEAVITAAFRLRAKHVIHTVSPIYSQHSENEVWRLLSSCYRNTLDLAHGHKANSIAFPSLGTGIYGIPIARACKVAIEEAEVHIAKRRPPHRIIFCCFSDQDAAIYRAELERRNG